MRGTRKKKSFRARLKPNEIKTREEQMRQFRYKCAYVTGKFLSLLSNSMIAFTVVVFIVTWLSGMYEGTPISSTIAKTYDTWKYLCTIFIPYLLGIVALLALSVRILGYDAKGRMLKVIKQANEKSVYALLVVMAVVAILYFDHVY